ncbi:hypothetical protein ACWELJ_25310 [Nocardia sp. NPDC004582]
MKRKNTIAVAVCAVAATAWTAGVVQADPAAGADPNSVHYEIGRQADSAVLSTPDGRVRIVADQLVLTDRADRPVASIPLTYRLDDVAYPIAAHIEGNTATLTPDRRAGQPVTPVARTEIRTVRQVSESFTPRDSMELGAFSQRVAIGSGVSAVLGAVLGGGVGCLVGAAAGAALSSPVIALLVPFVGATIAGCVLGAATLGAVGSMVGLITVGGPITLFSAFQYFSTILTPCPPELAYCKDPAQATPATK